MTDSSFFLLSTLVTISFNYFTKVMKNNNIVLHAGTITGALDSGCTTGDTDCTNLCYFVIN